MLLSQYVTACFSYYKIVNEQLCGLHHWCTLLQAAMSLPIETCTKIYLPFCFMMSLQIACMTMWTARDCLQFHKLIAAVQSTVESELLWRCPELTAPKLLMYDMFIEFSWSLSLTRSLHQGFFKAYNIYWRQLAWVLLGFLSRLNSLQIAWRSCLFNEIIHHRQWWLKLVQKLLLEYAEFISENHARQIVW